MCVLLLGNRFVFIDSRNKHKSWNQVFFSWIHHFISEINTNWNPNDVCTCLWRVFFFWENKSLNCHFGYETNTNQYLLFWIFLFLKSVKVCMDLGLFMFLGFHLLEARFFAGLNSPVHIFIYFCISLKLCFSRFTWAQFMNKGEDIGEDL